jgi:ergothioneine biosynthesis protein EgtB
MQASNPKMSPSRDLCAYYQEVRAYTEKLCEPLETEDYIPQPIVDVSPPRWNIAHTTWFFEEMVLRQFAGAYQEFDDSFRYLFNSYYNTVGDRTPREVRGSLSRPTVERVFKYRKYVDHGIKEFLLLAYDVHSRNPGYVPLKEIEEMVTLGLNHEQQHQELFLTDLKYTFSLNPLFPVYKDDFAIEEKAESGSEATVELEGGIYDIGYEGNGFCFDNELARHKVYLNDFEIDTRLITNLEFLEFVQDGGYRDHRLWHSDGWEWVNQNNVTSPLYWHHRDDEWFHFTMAGLRKLPMNAPVCHISYYEATAFAEWREMRLPTEFEWEAASDKFNWGLRWEWTNSAYLPYPGFKKAAGAVGEYNGKFMINQMVLRGASVATPDGHSRKTYRNFFQPPLRWQFTGLRLAK